jgi:hypothetical protein
MQFEYARPDGKKPELEEVPTHLSIDGREYKVEDFCIDAPAKFASELKMHGFVQRTRQTITVKGAAARSEK